MKPQQIVGLLCAVAASFGWPLFSLITKKIYIDTSISPYDMIYFRCLVPFLLLLPYSIVTSLDIIKIPRDISIDFFIRITFWVIGLFCNFVSLSILSLSKSTIIYFTNPIITSVLSYFIINEKLSVYDFFSSISSFLGVIIIATNKNKDKSNPIVVNEPWWGFIFPLLWAVFNALSDIYQRKISDRANSFVIQLWMYVYSMCLSPIISFGMHSAGHNDFKGFSFSFVLKLLIGGVIGIASLSIYMLALKYEKAGRVAAINYLQVFNAILIDIFYFRIHVGMRDILGAILIVASSFTITLLKAFEFIK